MTPKEIKERVAACYADDCPEESHRSRDDLFVDVLTFIAETSTDKVAAKLAKEALKTEEPGFRMWYG